MRSLRGSWRRRSIDEGGKQSTLKKVVVGKGGGGSCVDIEGRNLDTHYHFVCFI